MTSNSQRRHSPLAKAPMIAAWFLFAVALLAPMRANAQKDKTPPPPFQSMDIILNFVFDDGNVLVYRGAASGIVEGRTYQLIEKTGRKAADITVYHVNDIYFQARIVGVDRPLYEGWPYILKYGAATLNAKPPKKIDEDTVIRPDSSPPAETEIDSTRYYIQNAPRYEETPAPKYAPPPKKPTIKERAPTKSGYYEPPVKPGAIKKPAWKKETPPTTWPATEKSASGKTTTEKSAKPKPAKPMGVLVPDLPSSTAKAPLPAPDEKKKAPAPALKPIAETPIIKDKPRAEENLTDKKPAAKAEALPASKPVAVTVEKPAAKPEEKPIAKKPAASKPATEQPVAKTEAPAPKKTEEAGKPRPAADTTATEQNAAAPSSPAMPSPLVEAADVAPPEPQPKTTEPQPAATAQPAPTEPPPPSTPSAAEQKLARFQQPIPPPNPEPAKTEPAPAEEKATKTSKKSKTPESAPAEKTDKKSKKKEETKTAKPKTEEKAESKPKKEKKQAEKKSEPAKVAAKPSPPKEAIVLPPHHTAADFAPRAGYVRIEYHIARNSESNTLSISPYVGINKTHAVRADYIRSDNGSLTDITVSRKIGLREPRIAAKIGVFQFRERRGGDSVGGVCFGFDAGAEITPKLGAFGGVNLLNSPKARETLYELGLLHPMGSRGEAILSGRRLSGGAIFTSLGYQLDFGSNP